MKMRRCVVENCDAHPQKTVALVFGICMREHRSVVGAPPARVLSVAYGDEGLEVGTLQPVLQQLLGGVDVLRNALHALVQHPGALADLALQEREGPPPGGGGV